MSDQSLTQQEKVRRGAEDSGRFFRYMMEFVGFTDADTQAIKDSGLVIEKHLPSIVADFYTHLMRYPETRKHFLDQNGQVDQDYLQKRMVHLANFWRRTTGGLFDDEYARYIDYVGKAHTRHGADPNIYIAERYVIGQVGFMQHAISNALRAELHEIDPELETRAVRAWNLLLMVILEMLARAYNDQIDLEHEGQLLIVKRDPMHELAVEAYERGLGLTRPPVYREVFVANMDQIPDGGRKIVRVDDLSIGVFHHKGGWYAVRNHCVHRGGPVATGSLVGDILTCPLHGYKYNIQTGQLIVDPSSKLDTYTINLKGNEVYLLIPEAQPQYELPEIFEEEKTVSKEENERSLRDNEFLLAAIPPGASGLVHLGDKAVAVFNLDGQFYAISNQCTHAEGPLCEGAVKDGVVVCPWHGSCFNIMDGGVACGPATLPVATYPVTIDGLIGRVDPI